MRKIRDVIRLNYSAGISIRQIHSSTKISVGSVQKLLKKAQELKLSWPLPESLNDSELARLFYPQADTRSSSQFHIPEWAEVRKQLSMKGVTKQLLWEEYTHQYPNRCCSYSLFCMRYQDWLKKQRRFMRMHYKAGEVLFVDCAGQIVPIINPQTGEVTKAQGFVAAMGASHYYYAEATRTQSLKDWLNSHARTFEFMGGVPNMVVIDYVIAYIRHVDFS